MLIGQRDLGGHAAEDVVQEVLALYTKVCNHQRIQNPHECALPYLLNMVRWHVQRLAEKATRHRHWRQATLFEMRPDGRVEDPLEVASQVDEASAFVEHYLVGEEVLTYEALCRFDFNKKETAEYLQMQHKFSRAKAYRLMNRVNLAAARKEKDDRER